MGSQQGARHGMLQRSVHIPQQGKVPWRQTHQGGLRLEHGLIACQHIKTLVGGQEGTAQTYIRWCMEMEMTFMGVASGVEMISISVIPDNISVDSG